MARLLSIGTALPAGLLRQQEAFEQATIYNCASAREERVLQKLYKKTQIESRQTIFSPVGQKPNVSARNLSTLDSFYPRPLTASGANFKTCPVCDSASAASIQPGTAARMARYREEITPLATAAVAWPWPKFDLPAAAVENLITVSCTGFFSPGLDTQIIETLNLSRGVSRTHVGFMGCHGAMNGLRVGSALARANQSISLVVAAELCSLHFQYGCKGEAIRN